MNIIKLKDTIMPGNSEAAQIFNKYLKGKYAYWIHMRYIVSFDVLSENGYVACEEDINKLLKKEDGTYPEPYGAPCLDMYAHISDLYDDTALINIMDYIDIETTDKINNINDFKIKNSYTLDEDVTLDEVKVFRTWLAKELLAFDTNDNGDQLYKLFNTKETKVLQYYASNMMDNVIIALSEFGTNISYNSQKVTTGCGCCDSNIASLYNTELSICDPIQIYKTNIYNKMVEMFSDYKFWEDFSDEFILTFKKYVEGIIKAGLPLSKSEYVSVFADCGCIQTSMQDSNLIILKNLVEALNYIYHKDITGHKNFINDALTQWAKILYESMYWF